MIPAEFRQFRLHRLPDAGHHLGDALRSFREDEFVLDPTRLTLVCGTAGFDGTQFKGLLADEYEIQLNKTSRNSVLLQTNINNTRSDVAQPAAGAGRDRQGHRAEARRPAAKPSAAVVRRRASSR